MRACGHYFPPFSPHAGLFIFLFPRFAFGRHKGAGWFRVCARPNVLVQIWLHLHMAQREKRKRPYRGRISGRVRIRQATPADAALPLLCSLFFWVVDNFSMEKGTTTMTIVAKKKRGRVLVFLFAGNPFLLDLFFQMTTHRGSLFFFRTTKAPQKNAMAGLLGHIKTSIAHCPCIHTHQKKTKERKGSNLEKKRTTTGREISIVVVLWNHNALHIFKKKGTIIFFGLCCAYLFFIQARSCLSGLLNEEKTKKRCVSLHLAPGLSPSLFFFP